MNRLWRRLLWCAVVASLAASPTARGQAPAFSPRAGAPLEDLLTRATDCEQRELWRQAAEIYERAVRLYPQRDDLQKRWRRAERLYSLSRRYHDDSYVGELLKLSEPDAVDLLSEVLRKVEANYVEPVNLDRLVRIGYRDLRLALGEPVFRDRHFPGRSAEEIQRLRTELANRPRDRIWSVADARTEVLRASRLCRNFGAKDTVPVILEFLTSFCEELDPYSTHLSPNRLADLYAMIGGSFVGLGVEVRGDGDGLLILRVLPESPAKEAGLEPDDRIVAVDGRSLADLNSEEAANLLQGKVGSVVSLRLEKDRQQREVTVTRREVTVHSVTFAGLLDEHGGIGYVRLESFQKLTVDELERAISGLQRRGMRSLVLDLRGNPGGLLDVAVKVADHFIDDGILVSTKGRAWGQSFDHRAEREQDWGFPLVVLVDGESASASEILAGAVKDHGRGLIVGMRTYGKGSVQSIFPLRSARTGLRLTTARFYSPKGHAYEGIGVEPDVAIARPSGPLGEPGPISATPAPEADAQLREAVRLLANRRIATK